jgi:5-methylcytosine-specific restriction endonuclease McrA
VPLPSGWASIRRMVIREEKHCFYCGAWLLNQQGYPAPSATVDHKIPRARGGTDERSNLCACCAACQQAKGSREGAEGAALAKARA